MTLTVNEQSQQVMDQYDSTIWVYHEPAALGLYDSTRRNYIRYIYLTLRALGHKIDRVTPITAPEALVLSCAVSATRASHPDSYETCSCCTHERHLLPPVPTKPGLVAPVSIGKGATLIGHISAGQGPAPTMQVLDPLPYGKAHPDGVWELTPVEFKKLRESHIIESYSSPYGMMDMCMGWPLRIVEGKPECVCGVKFTGGLHSDWCLIENAH